MEPWSINDGQTIYLGDKSAHPRRRPKTKNAYKDTLITYQFGKILEVQYVSPSSAS